jgi:hypothetical protein
MHQRAAIKLRQPNTGVWFLEEPVFKSWVATPNSKLWLYGIREIIPKLPDGGTSILWTNSLFHSWWWKDCSDVSFPYLAYIRNTLNVNAGALSFTLFPKNQAKPTVSISYSLQSSKISNAFIAIVYFYCDYKDSKTHDPSIILSSLVRQLAIQDGGAFEKLEDFYNDHLTVSNHNTPPTATPEQLSLLFQSMCSYFESVMIIIDALDECQQNRAHVVELLAGINCDSSNNIKMLFSSRW